jgi:hypothetical protein
LGCPDVIIDSDIIFLVVSILRPHYFNLLKTALKWRIFISQEIEEEIVDPVSFSLKERLLKEGFWEYFTPPASNKQKKSWPNIKTSEKSYIREKRVVMLSPIARGFRCYLTISKNFLRKRTIPRMF